MYGNGVWSLVVKFTVMGRMIQPLIFDINNGILALLVVA